MHAQLYIEKMNKYRDKQRKKDERLPTFLSGFFSFLYYADEMKS